MQAQLQRADKAFTQSIAAANPLALCSDCTPQVDIFCQVGQPTGQSTSQLGNATGTDV